MIIYHFLDVCKKLSDCDPLKWLNENGERFGQSRVEIESKLKNAKCGKDEEEEIVEIKVQCPENQTIGLCFNNFKSSFCGYNLEFIGLGSVKLSGFANLLLVSALIKVVCWKSRGWGGGGLANSFEGGTWGCEKIRGGGGPGGCVL